METYIIEWLSLIFRWLHVITGVAWIGASFYFVWLDNSLQNPPQWKKDKGIKGDLWAIHGGGIYEVAKYRLQPEKMPETLHWFKWEAYTTWITGMLLLAIIYYLGADSYLIDKRVADLSQLQAIALGLGIILGSWVIYELLCSSQLAKNGLVISALLILFATTIAFLLTQLFSGRGAYIHFGAVIGTLMAGNVFRVIIPGQKALVAAIIEGKEPEAKWAEKAKLHSTHNTYLTLPLLFIMISNHYPITYDHNFNWLILLAITAITAIARQFFILKHKGLHKPSILIVSAMATLALAILIAPKQIMPSVTVKNIDKSQLTVQVLSIIKERCATCHAKSPTDEVFSVAPGGVALETMDDIHQWAPQINARSVQSHNMPFMNKTGMTQEERNTVARWLELKDQAGN
ncbi:MAG: urate hydroxylase PuuD [Porticoccaceae bacterium]|nr:urate hydroxylase PuuD [Porticoccaceae bacterium]